MIYLGETRNLISIAEEWAKAVFSFLDNKFPVENGVKVKYAGETSIVYKRIDKYELSFGNKCLENGISDIDWKEVWRKLLKYLTQVDYLTADPKELDNLKKDILTDKEVLQENIKKICVKIYNDFIRDKGYEFMLKLGIRTCPYCNRHYTFTISKSKNNFSTRPEYDHFYDKKTYPHLALSFYNLIPSCRECNHNKRNKPLGVNPYSSNFKSKFVITDNTGSKILDLSDVLSLKSEAEFGIKFLAGHIQAFQNPVDEEMLNINTLGLEPLYNGHKDFVLELIEKRNSYDIVTQQGIVDEFQGIFHSSREVFEFIWGRYFEEEAYDQRPLSKFARDILDQLGLKGT